MIKVMVDCEMRQNIYYHLNRWK